jgi:hypothetical protein
VDNQAFHELPDGFLGKNGVYLLASKSLQRRNTMKHFARLMLLTLGIGVVAVVLSFLPRRTAAAAPNPPAIPVNVENTPNVHVTNTPNVNATISGSPSFAATQSGIWNVGITNTAASPVPVQSANQATTNYVSLITSNATGSIVWEQVTPSGTTPPFTLSGQQLVITDVTWQATCVPANGCLSVAGDQLALSFGSYLIMEAPTRLSPEQGTGTLVAYGSEHLNTGIIISALPYYFINDEAPPGVFTSIEVQGYLIP